MTDRIALSGAPGSPYTRKMLGVLRYRRIPYRLLPPSGPALVIDGLFGIGLNRGLDANWVKFIEKVNEYRRKVLAVDVPSGLNAETGEPQPVAVRAAVTLTVGAPKIGMLQRSAWEHVGRIEVADQVGLIPCPIKTELLWTLANDFQSFPPARTVA